LNCNYTGINHTISSLGIAPPAPELRYPDTRDGAAALDRVAIGAYGQFASVASSFIYLCFSGFLAKKCPSLSCQLANSMDENQASRGPKGNGTFWQKS